MFLFQTKVNSQTARSAFGLTHLAKHVWTFFFNRTQLDRNYAYGKHQIVLVWIQIMQNVSTKRDSSLFLTLVGWGLAPQ